MNPIVMLILICSANVFTTQCQPSTALDVIRGPDASNEVTCASMGKRIIAATALRPRFRAEYVKIICTQTEPP
jgi:hypothetical protein